MALPAPLPASFCYPKTINLTGYSAAGPDVALRIRCLISETWGLAGKPRSRNIRLTLRLTPSQMESAGCETLLDELRASNYQVQWIIRRQARIAHVPLTAILEVVYPPPAWPAGLSPYEPRGGTLRE